MSSTYGARLFDQHAQLLAASAISAEVAAEREYVSVGEKTMLVRYGFSKSAVAKLTVPGLLVPRWTVDGVRDGCQYRPDVLRVDDRGRARKYETPYGQRNRFDVHPRVHGVLGDPSVPLWFTEGARKADAAISAGIMCVSIIGVNGWRGRNAHGGLSALSDFHDLALNGREIVLAFDADVVIKDAVAAALAELAGYLGSKKAHVRYLHLPLELKGVDDFLAVRPLDDLLARVADTPPKTSSARAMSGPTEHAPARDDGEPVDGAELLKEVAALFERFVAFVNVHQSVAVALWVVHTWAFDAADTSPRLSVQSPERESGKTRLLEVAELVVREPMQALDATPAALFRSIAVGPVTFLVDEVDTVFTSNSKDEKSDVRAILNAGYRRGAVVPRADAKTKQVERCPVFSPVALAGIGPLPDTVQSRAIVIGLRRRKKTEPVERLRRRRVAAEGIELRARIERWTTAHVGPLRDADPEIPDELGDRMQDCWEPLLAIADAAGGDCAKQAREAARALSGPVDASEDNVTIALLSDIRDIFGTVERLASRVLADKLADIDDSPWADWYGKPITPTAVARLLRGHAKPKLQRPAKGSVFRGYFRVDFEDSWARYLPPLPEGP
jgi:hypothetical protein